MKKSRSTTILKNSLVIAIIFFIKLYSIIAFAQSTSKVAYTPPANNLLETNSGFTIYQNLRYGPIPDSIDSSTSDRILDLYLPKSKADKISYPIFFFIHGGGFTGGDKNVKDICTKMVNKGFAVVSINYRLTLKYKKAPGSSCSANMAEGLPKNGQFHPLLQTAINNASQDAAMALTWVKENAIKYNLDINKLVVSGGSAGSMTALHLAYVSKQKIIPIKAVINLWGGLENASVIKKDAPPLLTYHGDKDDIINVAYAYAINDRMKGIKSNKSQLIILKDKGHALYKLIGEEKIDEIVSFIKNVM
ncbi:alpha/beta hydrolase [Pedobacter puniceum]|uniref:Alpha/beta hydrolase fold domain-containing protein n=1 Tax=Pedobacter puniceum TaxID=2666136 RepID=A0A7K0FPJ9_9SPHI|nr:alpha/beta hydrolase [Pedobacter puniceum]MRX47180.1 alpha/beta hydrolase fold domain-containing protein [Pedobacter puniceum]